MIPTIEQIIEDLLAGSITKSQAVTWLLQHAESAHQDLRDYFAGEAISPLVRFSNDRTYEIESAKAAYRYADALMEARTS